MEYLRTERSEAGVETIWLARPPVNALSRGLLAELGSHLQTLVDDVELKAVVITGEGRAFAAGADIGEFDLTGAGTGVSDTFRGPFDLLGAIPRPVIAAVNGFALGGGFELALACDLRIAADNAKVGFPEILLGIFPGAGGTQRAARIVGPARAKELIWSGRQVEADEALALGLVERVVPAADLVATAQDWAAEFAEGAVSAMGLAKGAIDRGLDASLAAGLDLEAEAFGAVFRTEDARIGIESFLAHGPGKAEFTGR